MAPVTRVRPRSRRAALVLAVGLVALGAGLALYVVPLAMEGPSVVDVVGTLGVLAAVALIVLAVRAIFGGRSWRVKALGVVAGLVLAQWYLVPAINGGVATHAPHRDVPAAATLGLPGARDVRFPAADGTQLAGWYVPGRTGAAVVLLHGSHGTRADTARHLRMLAGAGLAVLAVDARGHGESAGRTNALGWRGADDVAGAVRFLARQPGVNRRRIAALGLSMGGEEALRAAAGGVPLRAVVADGAGASTLADRRVISDAAIPTSVEWMGLRATELLSGDHEPEGLVDAVHRIRVPVLLIASGASGERKIDTAFARSIGPRAQLWPVLDAGHTEALRDHPAAYAARVQAFLAGALGE